MRAALALVLLSVLTGVAGAQDKPTVTGYLGQGFEIVHVESGNPFLTFILRKENQLVWCSVLLQSGETQSCRTLK